MMMLVKKHKSDIFSSDELSIKNLYLASPSLIKNIPENLKEISQGNIPSIESKTDFSEVRINILGFISISLAL